MQSYKLQEPKSSMRYLHEVPVNVQGTLTDTSCRYLNELFGSCAECVAGQWERNIYNGGSAWVTDIPSWPRVQCGHTTHFCYKWQYVLLWGMILVEWISQFLKPDQFGHVDWRPLWPGITTAGDFSDRYHLTAEGNNEHNLSLRYSA